MIKSVAFFSGRVAGQTSRTVVRIAIHAVVMIIRFRIGMTGDAGKLCVIRGVCMAVLALLPFAFVFSTVNREIFCVVLRVFCRHPVQIGRVTLDTIL